MKKKKCLPKTKKQCDPIEDTLPPISELPIIRMRGGKYYNLVVISGDKRKIRIAQKIISIAELTAGYINDGFQKAKLTIEIKFKTQEHETYNRIRNSGIEISERTKSKPPKKRSRSKGTKRSAKRPAKSKR